MNEEPIAIYERKLTKKEFVAGVAWLWLAVLLDTLATVLCLQNALRVLRPKN